MGAGYAGHHATGSAQPHEDGGGGGDGDRNGGGDEVRDEGGDGVRNEGGEEDGDIGGAGASVTCDMPQWRTRGNLHLDLNPWTYNAGRSDAVPADALTFDTLRQGPRG